MCRESSCWDQQKKGALVSSVLFLFLNADAEANEKEISHGRVWCEHTEVTSQCGRWLIDWLGHG